MININFYKINTPKLSIYIEVPKDTIGNDKNANNRMIIEFARKLNLISESEILTLSSIKELSEDEFDEVMHIQKHLSHN